MLIFGREVPSTKDIAELVSCVMHNDGIWQKSKFKESAKLCGFKRINERKSGYFSLAIFEYATGQAIIAGDVIEEIRIFIGSEPADLDMDSFEKDQKKAGVLAKEYIKALEETLGHPRQSNSNSIFELRHLRVRVLAPQPVWVVISNLHVIKALDRDYWPKNA